MIILNGVDVSKITETDKDDFVIRLPHVKPFLDSYYDYLEIADIYLALTINLY